MLSGHAGTALLLNTDLRADPEQLSETIHSPEAIAREAGFGTEATMHKSFPRVLQVSPLEYRNRFS